MVDHITGGKLIEQLGGVADNAAPASKASYDYAEAEEQIALDVPSIASSIVEADDRASSVGAEKESKSLWYRTKSAVKNMTATPAEPTAEISRTTIRKDSASAHTRARNIQATPAQLQAFKART